MHSRVWTSVAFSPWHSKHKKSFRSKMNQSKNLLGYLFCVLGTLFLLTNVFTFHYFPLRHEKNDQTNIIRQKRSSADTQHATSPKNLERLEKIINHLGATVANIESDEGTLTGRMANMNLIKNTFCKPMPEPVQNTSQGTLKVIMDKCGGVVQSDHGTIRYKPDETYNNYEYCIWTIVTNKTWVEFNMTKIGVYRNGDFVSVLNINPSGRLQVAHKFDWYMGKSNKTINSGHALVTFTSDGSQTGNGFQLEFTAGGPINTAIGYTATYTEENEGVFNPVINDDKTPVNYHIFTQRSTDKSVLFTSDLHNGTFHRLNTSRCEYESVTAYELSLQKYIDRLNITQLGKLPESTSTTDCPEVIRAGVSTQWFTTTKPSFVMIYRQIRPSNGGNINAGVMLEYKAFDPFYVW